MKLYAWEPSFQAKVDQIRNEEVKVLKQAAYLSAGTYFMWTIAPLLVSFNFKILELSFYLTIVLILYLGHAIFIHDVHID